VQFKEVAAKAAGVPHMTPEQGRIIYDHVREHRPKRILELGTAHGVSAAYMAAALRANGNGVVDTIDSVYGAKIQEPSATEVVKRAGVEDLVNLIHIPDTSYNWWLKNRIRQRSDAVGNCDPVYDFCYLDGAHNFTIDGLAFYLVDRLLTPGAWLLIDDLDWSYEKSSTPRGAGVGEVEMSDDEYRSLPMREIFDLLVQPHPNYSNFKIQDDRWGWAEKTISPTKRLTLETSESLSAKAARFAKSRLGRIPRRVG